MQAKARSEAAFEGEMRPMVVADRGSSSSSPTSSSSTPPLRNALLPPPLTLVPQSQEASMSVANVAQGLPVVVKVRS